jgi:hypothetical protein
MMIMPDALRRFRFLLAAADHGAMTLPEPVGAARAAIGRIGAALQTLQPVEPAHAVFDKAVAAAVTADDPTTVNLDAVLSHPDRQKRHEALLGVLRAAAAVADQNLRDVVADHAEQIVTDHIQPAGGDLWKRIVAAAKTLDRPASVNADAMLTATDRQRRAYVELGDLSVRYKQLRAALSDIPFDDTPIIHDIAADHSEFREGLCSVAGPNFNGLPSNPNKPKMPWHDFDDRGRLLWLVEAGVTPWFPLPADRDRLWMEHHREAYERAAEQGRRQQGAKAWTSSFAG